MHALSCWRCHRLAESAGSILTTNLKAAGVTPTPATAQEITHPQFTPLQARIANLRTRAALAKTVLHVIESDGATIFIFSRWGMCRQVETIDAAERWLDGVTGARLEYS